MYAPWFVFTLVLIASIVSFCVGAFVGYDRGVSVERARWLNDNDRHT